MRQLFWKEWHEMRLLPLASAAGTAVAIFAYVTYARAAEHRHDLPVGVSDTLLWLLAAWHLTALVIGAGMFSPEIGGGGLLFLSALPVSRRRLWWVKVTAAVAVLLVCLVADTLACFLVDQVLFGASAASGTPSLWIAAPGKLAIYLFSVVGFFVAALAVSPFLDRTLSTIFMDLTVCIVGLMLESNFINQHLVIQYGSAVAPWPAHPAPYFAVGVSSIFVCGTISYWTFTRGETLRSVKRFRVGAISAAASVTFAVTAFWAGSCLRWW